MPIDGVPRTLRPAVGELDVVDRGLEPVRGDGRDAVAEDRRRVADRARRHRAAAAAGRPRTEARQRGVALDRVHVLDVHTERVGGELHDRRLDAVPVEPPAM